jgi:methylated-DNA-[protein]-cysteine S-methyltransferase
MRCEDVIERLDAFRTRELSRREMGGMRTHFADCASCADELAEVEALAADCAGLGVRCPDAVAAGVLAATGDRYGSVDTDLGRVWVAFNECGIALVHVGTGEVAFFEQACESRLGRRGRPAEVPELYARAIRVAAAGSAPAAGTGSGDPPVDLSTLSPFERRVLTTLRTIPRGEVRPYAWLAREVGHPRAVRAVGNALARNPVPLILPCHRVVPTAGGVGNYRFGSRIKRVVLEREGVPVDDLARFGREGVRCLGCASTGIYCLPTCHAVRRARPENRVPFASQREAEGAGYRPCRLCRPAASAA